MCYYYIELKFIYIVYIVYILLLCLLLQDGWTALHFAAYNNRPEIIKILISNGVDITVVNKV